MYLGRYGQSAETLQQALDLCEREGLDEFVPMLLTALGENNFLRRRYHAAARVFERLMEMGDALPKKEHDEAVFGLSKALTYLGRPGEALVVLDKGFETPPMPSHITIVYWSRANCLYELGRYEEALESAEIAENNRASLQSSGWLVAPPLMLSRCCRKLGRIDEAMEWFEIAVGRYTARRDFKADFDWRESFGGTGTLVMTSGVILEQEGKPRSQREMELFELFQRFKVRSLIDRITEPRRQSEPGSQFARIDPVGLRELQLDVLEPGELFLDFVAGEGITYLFAISRDSCRVVELPGEFSRFAERVSVYRNFLGRRPPGQVSSGVDVERMGESIGSAILGEVQDLVRVSSALIVSPSGFYGGVPFGALFLPGKDGAAHAVIESRTIHRVPSATVLAWLRSKAPVETPPGNAVLAIAPVREDGLQGAVREVDTIRRRYAGVRLQTGMSDAVLQRSAESFGVIHVAAHIEVNDEKPWHSGILVGASDEGDEFQADPFLRAGEIASLRMPSRLTVLSGCESAMGRQKVGEGVAGLTAAFLSAGVNSVVATLWRVDDAVTATLMERFYRGLADGIPVAAALRRAQLETRADPHTGHPFYWAGFVVVGAGGVPIQLESRVVWGAIPPHWLLLGAVVAAYVVWILFRYRKL
jgi:hypothetical protein